MSPARQATPAHPARSSAPATASQQYRVFDRGKGEVKPLLYPTDSVTQRYAFQARVDPSATTDAVVPAGTPWRPTGEHLRIIPACDVDTFMPKHFNQSFGTSLRHECSLGERLELQDCINRGVWGDSVRIVAGMIVIGLMWVYVTKKSQPGGLFLRVRSRS